MATNPFASRFIRPGAVPFFFPAAGDAEEVIGRLRRHRWRGQIVGPHGSGKSTLLATLQPLLEQAGCSVHRATLHQGQRRLPRGFPRPIWRAGDSTPLLVVDGCEQLSRWRWWQLRWWVRRYRAGLLITTHRPLGLPSIWETRVDEDLARRVVTYLLDRADRDPSTQPTPVHLTSEEIGAALLQAGGDLREALFRLYDVYAQRAAAPKRGCGAHPDR